MASGSIRVRKSEERGHANHGWLDSYHTFSFADYYDPKYDGYGCLRVINEDRVTPKNGFGTHHHRDFEIFSYIISGELEHKDSMGNTEIIHRGEVQFTSAGTGIRHSEYNVNPSTPVHFIQIWVKPKQNGLQPSYTTMKFPEENKRGKLCKIVSGEKDPSSIFVNNDIHVYASLLDKGVQVKHRVAADRKAYIHVCQTGGQIEVNGTVLNGGDGAFIESVEELNIVGASDGTAEFLLFDLKA